jgi:hypothetical protein
LLSFPWPEFLYEFSAIEPLTEVPVVAPFVLLPFDVLGSGEAIINIRQTTCGGDLIRATETRIVRMVKCPQATQTF